MRKCHYYSHLQVRKPIFAGFTYAKELITNSLQVILAVMESRKKGKLIVRSKNSFERRCSNTLNLIFLFSQGSVTTDAASSRTDHHRKWRSRIKVRQWEVTDQLFPEKTTKVGGAYSSPREHVLSGKHKLHNKRLFNWAGSSRPRSAQCETRRKERKIYY